LVGCCVPPSNGSHRNSRFRRSLYFYYFVAALDPPKRRVNVLSHTFLPVASPLPCPPPHCLRHRSVGCCVSLSSGSHPSPVLRPSPNFSTSGRRTTDGQRLCRPLLTRAGHRTHDTHEGFFVGVAPGAGGAIPCGYGGHIGDRREGGSGCVFFVHARPIFVLCVVKNASRTRQRSQESFCKRKKPVRVYQRPDVGLKEIKRKGSDLVPRSAK
jgi:hypothetical protein